LQLLKRQNLLTVSSFLLLKCKLAPLRVDILPVYVPQSCANPGDLRAVLASFDAECIKELPALKSCVFNSPLLGSSFPTSRGKTKKVGA
jgi:hypothetical protein